MGVGGNTHGVSGVAGIEVWAVGTGAVGEATGDSIGPVNDELGMVILEEASVAVESVLLLRRLRSTSTGDKTDNGLVAGAKPVRAPLSLFLMCGHPSYGQGRGFFTS